MIISELIAHLEELKEANGDLPVYADPNVDGIEVTKYGYSSISEYIYIRGVREDEHQRND